MEEPEPLKITDIPAPPLSQFRFGGIQLDDWAWTPGPHLVKVGRDCPWEMTLREFKKRMRRAALGRDMSVRCWSQGDRDLYVEFRPLRSEWPAQYTMPAPAPVLEEMTLKDFLRDKILREVDEFLADPSIGEVRQRPTRE